MGYLVCWLLFNCFCLCVCSFCVAWYDVGVAGLHYFPSPLFCFLEHPPRCTALYLFVDFCLLLNLGCFSSQPLHAWPPRLPVWHCLVPIRVSCQGDIDNVRCLRRIPIASSLDAGCAWNIHYRTTISSASPMERLVRNARPLSPT
jgi:hypothetical protein